VAGFVVDGRPELGERGGGRRPLLGLELRAERRRDPLQDFRVAQQVVLDQRIDGRGIDPAGGGRLR
jgi:hypothetical protein